jgi:hypothetical protein
LGIDANNVQRGSFIKAYKKATILDVVRGIED